MYKDKMRYFLTLAIVEYSRVRRGRDAIVDTYYDRLNAIRYLEEAYLYAEDDDTEELILCLIYFVQVNLRGRYMANWKWFYRPAQYSALNLMTA